MTPLSNQHFSKLSLVSKLTIDSRCYLAPAQRTRWANYSLASNILTNFPEALSHHLNRILFTAQWHKVSIKQPVSPDTSRLIDGSWQWMIISGCQWVVPPNLSNLTLTSECKKYKQIISIHNQRGAPCACWVLRLILYVMVITAPPPPGALPSHLDLQPWHFVKYTCVSKCSICSSRSTPKIPL